MTTTPPRTAVVTGATRGIGRGLAIGLAETGAHVIITGRTLKGPTSLSATAEAIVAAGGTCDFFQVDHSDDAAVEAFFDNLVSLLSSRQTPLDLFVNNAYSAVGFIMASMNVPFWRKSTESPTLPADGSPSKVWDHINGVGLRGNYICSVYAIRIMRPNGGLLVNITSWAGLISLFDPAYSIGKAAVDRLSAEVAAAAPPGIRCITLCPGFVSTDALIEESVRRDADENALNLPRWNCETPLFVGRVLAAVANATPKVLNSMNGRVVIVAEAADLLHVEDEVGFRAFSFRSIRYNAMAAAPQSMRDSWLLRLIPRTLRAPWFLTRAVVDAHRFWN